MKKGLRIISILLLSVILMQNIAFAEFEWAKDAVEYCTDGGILAGDEEGNLNLGDNLTREQMSKVLLVAFGLVPKRIIEEDEIPTFSDVDIDRWSYLYVESFVPFMKKKGSKFKPEEYVTREEFASSLVLASGLKESNIRNSDILEFNFKDYKEVDNDYKKLMCIAVERGYYKGTSQMLKPKDCITRAEACSLLYRVLGAQEGIVTLDLGVIPSETFLVGEPEVSLEEAKAWAERMGAHQRFIDIADIYWKYGEITGIRPDILYAQAAKETGYGKYGGAVIPEQNNWAGIKTKSAIGDRMEDHETFETPDDGVRGHFNHMSAYIGLEPVGEPHGRYFSVKSIKWAGTVRTLEELGGKWCPDLYYGYSILHRYIEKM